MAKLPNKLIVGIVDRHDTYTGKLGFVSYPKSTKDPNTPHHSGVLGWVRRNNSKHPLMLLDNEPTTGFVINKKVGGKKPYYSEYKGRTVKARVYDPRGFEFEIDMENMCHILENNGSYPGKALEGEFVYAWMGSGSVFLLSCNSSEYKNLTKVVDKIETPLLKMAELEPFKTYKRIGGGDAIYLGDMDEVDVYQNILWGFKSKKHPFFDLTNKQVQYPKDIIGVSENQVDFKTVAHKYSYKKHYLAEKGSVSVIPIPIKLKTLIYKEKHYSEAYWLYSDDPEVIDNIPKRTFLYMDGRLYNVTKFSEDQDITYSERLMKTKVDKEIGIVTKFILCVTQYSNDFTINDKNIIVPLKDDRFRFDSSMLVEEFNDKSNNLYVAKFGKLIEY